jgi:hypothetical protein
MAELRRMWLLSKYHRQGFSYQLVMQLFAFARAAGYRHVRLSTSVAQERAIRGWRCALLVIRTAKSSH